MLERDSRETRRNVEVQQPQLTQTYWQELHLTGDNYKHVLFLSDAFLDVINYPQKTEFEHTQVNCARNIFQWQRNLER